MTSNANSRPLRTEWQRKFLRFETHHPAVQRLADECQAWMIRLIKSHEDGRLLAIVGGNGAGKSTSLRRMERFVQGIRFTALWREAARPLSVYWHDFPTLCDEMEDVKDLADALTEIIAADVLFLDDIGAERDRFKSGLGLEMLRRILGPREHRWTVVATNIRPADWRARWDNRVADRLLRNSVVLDMNDCPSWTIAGNLTPPTASPRHNDP